MGGKRKRDISAGSEFFLRYFNQIKLIFCILDRSEISFGWPDRIGSDRIGSDRIGLDRIGSDRIGSDRIGSDRIGSDRIGSKLYF